MTLRFDDAPSAVAPFVGTTCQNPASVASVTVRFNTTALAWPGATTPPPRLVPVDTATRTVPPAGTTPDSRVSSTRRGDGADNGTYRPLVASITGVK